MYVLKVAFARLLTTMEGVQAVYSWILRFWSGNVLRSMVSKFLLPIVTYMYLFVHPQLKNLLFSTESAAWKQQSKYKIRAKRENDAHIEVPKKIGFRNPHWKVNQSELNITQCWVLRPGDPFVGHRPRISYGTSRKNFIVRLPHTM